MRWQRSSSSKTLSIEQLNRRWTIRYLTRRRRIISGGIDHNNTANNVDNDHPTSSTAQHHAQLPLLLGAIPAQRNQEPQELGAAEGERQVHAALGAPSKRALQVQRVLVPDNRH